MELRNIEYQFTITEKQPPKLNSIEYLIIDPNFPPTFEQARSQLAKQRFLLEDELGIVLYNTTREENITFEPGKLHHHASYNRFKKKREDGWKEKTTKSVIIELDYSLIIPFDRARTPIARFNLTHFNDEPHYMSLALDIIKDSRYIDLTPRAKVAIEELETLIDATSNDKYLHLLQERLRWNSQKLTERHS